MPSNLRIESLLSARQFLAPRLVEGVIYFISDLSGRLSLYRMEAREGGSVPEPLLPPHLSLQNPHLMNGYSFVVFPGLGKILLMLDHDGDENYQPMWVPLTGGFPEPAFPQLAGCRVHAGEADVKRNIIYFSAESRQAAQTDVYRADLAAGTLESLFQSKWGAGVAAHSADHRLAVIGEGYAIGDQVLFLHRQGEGRPTVIYGKPMDERQPGEQPPLAGIFAVNFVNNDQGLLFISALFEDTYGLSYLDLANGGPVQPVTVTGVQHAGRGQMAYLRHQHGNCFRVDYNIDGVSWGYEGEFDAAAREMRLGRLLYGQGAIGNGVLEAAHYDKATGAYSLSYSTATSPTQIYTLPPEGAPVAITRERVLGVPTEWLSPGEDASFTSHDGLSISARLYLPAPALGFEGPRPLVYYVHGGPQSQERPDFAWFSMPLIQYLTLNGFAVFVPNVRGSTGYGLAYMKHVDKDWGGQDRLDHVHAMTQVLPNDPRLDLSRAAVVGRSYGGYMTLTLAARHPELWSAAVDMFGPYNLITFINRLPPTWQPYFHLVMGHPDKDRDFLLERSPATYIENVRCPLLIIQGRNDPRVIEPESRDVVERLRALGKSVDYLVFDNEGHDILKFENKVRCYNAITDFFKEHLRP